MWFANLFGKEGVKIGERRSELSLTNKSYITEYHPHVRVKPVMKWEWRKANGKYTIDFSKEANPHVNISGMSGFGKSTLCKKLIDEIRGKLKLPVAIFDVHSEYVELTKQLNGEVHSAKESSINMWELDGMAPAERIAENVGMLKRILKLGDIQAYSLLVSAEKAYERKGIIQSEKSSWSREAPTMQDVYECVLEHNKKQGYAGLSKRLYPLLMSSVFSAETSVSFKKVLDGLNDFSMAELRSSEAQAVFIETFLRKLYSYMLSQKLADETRLFVVIDEAHRVCIADGSELSLPGRIVSEGRKYGVGVITSNQMVKSIDRAIVANSAVTFAFYQREPEEFDYVAKLLAGGEEYEREEAVRSMLRNLKQFQCIALTSREREPTVVEIPSWKN